MLFRMVLAMILTALYFYFIGLGVDNKKGAKFSKKEIVCFFFIFSVVMWIEV